MGAAIQVGGNVAVSVPPTTSSGHVYTHSTCTPKLILTGLPPTLAMMGGTVTADSRTLTSSSRVPSAEEVGCVSTAKERDARASKGGRPPYTGIFGSPAQKKIKRGPEIPGAIDTPVLVSGEGSPWASALGEPGPFSLSSPASAGATMPSLMAANKTNLRLNEGPFTPAENRAIRVAVHDADTGPVLWNNVGLRLNRDGAELLAHFYSKEFNCPKSKQL